MDAKLEAYREAWTALAEAYELNFDETTRRASAATAWKRATDYLTEAGNDRVKFMERSEALTAVHHNVIKGRIEPVAEIMGMLNNGLVGVAFQTLQASYLPGELHPVLDAQFQTVLKAMNEGDSASLELWMKSNSALMKSAGPAIARDKKMNKGRKTGTRRANEAQKAKARILEAKVKTAWGKAITAGNKTAVVDIVAYVCDEVGCSEPTVYKYRPKDSH